jgi:signal transduction histidine kinase
VAQRPSTQGKPNSLAILDDEIGTTNLRCYSDNLMREEGVARLAAQDEAHRALALTRRPEVLQREMLQRIVEIAVQLVEARYGALGVVGTDGYLSDFLTTGLSTEERECIGHLPRGHGLLGLLIRWGESVCVPRISRDPRHVGFPAQHPCMTSLLGVPIRMRDLLVGAVYLTDKRDGTDFTADDQRLIELLAAHAAVAIENAQLAEVAILRERERIARDLHDAVMQDIYADVLRLGALAQSQTNEALRTALREIDEHLCGAVGDIRTYIHDLQAEQPTGYTLPGALAALVADVSRQGALQVTFALRGTPYALAEALTQTLRQITREAIANVVQHAAASRAEVLLDYGEMQFTLSIVDDGKGFNVALVRGEQQQGLRNMRARTREAGGIFSLRSGPGTHIDVSIPRPR